MFLRTGVLKICSEFKGEHPCSDFNKVALQRYLQVNIGLALRPHWVLEAMLFFANLSFKKLFHFFFASSLFILFLFPYFSRSMKGRYIHFLLLFTSTFTGKVGDLLLCLQNRYMYCRLRQLFRFYFIFPVEIWLV